MQTLWAVPGGAVQRLRGCACTVHRVCAEYLHSEHRVCNLPSVCVHAGVHTRSSRMGSTLLPGLPQSCSPAPPPQPRGVRTDGLAVLGQRVHLVARVALALKVALVIDTDLAAGIWVLTLVNVCGGSRGQHWPEEPPP